MYIIFKKQLRRSKNKYLILTNIILNITTDNIYILNILYI